MVVYADIILFCLLLYLSKIGLLCFSCVYLQLKCCGATGQWDYKGSKWQADNSALYVRISHLNAYNQLSFLAFSSS